MDVWRRSLSSKDKEMARRSRENGWASLEVGTKMDDIFTFLESWYSRTAAGLRAEATHSAAGSHTDVPLALCRSPLPGILGFSKLMGK